MRRTSLCLLATAIATNAFAAELTRPPARGSSPLASAVAATAAPGTTTPGASYLASLTPDVQKKLQAENQALMGEEKADKGSYGGYIRAVAIFKQSKKRVFELMTDTAAQALYLPHIDSATVEARPPNGELTQFILKFIWKSVKFHVQHWFYPEQSRSEWALDPSAANDIKGQEGYWQLFELGPDLTIGEYGTRIETGIAVPKFIQDIFARADIPKALTAFRKYMDSNGTYRRD